MPSASAGSRSKKGAVRKNGLSVKRQLKQSTYKSFKYSKRIRQPKPPIIGAFKLFIMSCRFLIKRWRLFSGIVLVYFVLTIILVKGFGVSSDIGQLNDVVRSLFHGRTAELASSLTIYNILLGNVNRTTTDVASAYQSLLLLIMSLVIIWAIRAGSGTKKIKITVRDAFYKGLYPFVPFLLVLMVIGLQLIPMVIVNFLYAKVFGEGLAITAIEKGLWITILGLIVLLVLYMITSSIFALYIVTLPDVRPMQALRSARELVRHRRWVIMRKLLFLPLALLVLFGLIIVPTIIVSPAVAEWLLFALSMVALAIGHSYIYHLYRDLL